MSTIGLNWRERKITGAQTPRRFIDFVIDGTSFYDQLEQDLISPLGWLPLKYHREAINRILVIGNPDFADGRVSIFVCGECGDLGCGALSAFIEKVDDRIVWRDFRHQNNYDPDIGYPDENYSHLGPFSFDIIEYNRTIGESITLFK